MPAQCYDEGEAHGITLFMIRRLAKNPCRYNRGEIPAKRREAEAAEEIAEGGTDLVLCKLSTSAFRWMLTESEQARTPDPMFGDQFGQTVYECGEKTLHQPLPSLVTAVSNNFSRRICRAGVGSSPLTHFTVMMPFISPK